MKIAKTFMTYGAKQFLRKFWLYFASVRINLSMKSVSSDSKLLICFVCFSISFSSLEKLSVFCEVGTLFSEWPLWVFVLFIFPCTVWA